MSKYKLHSRGENWFHFREDMKSAMESFSVTYCHDGTVCMTGDMGCLTWQRQYVPETLDYGFPNRDTGIDYFAEKIVRSGGTQVIKAWDKELAYTEIEAAIAEYAGMDEKYADRCTNIEALECVRDSLFGFESGDYGYYQMIAAFNEMTHSIEGETWSEFGWRYSNAFKMRFEMLQSVSHLILAAVASSALEEMDTDSER